MIAEHDCRRVMLRLCQSPLTLANAHRLTGTDRAMQTQRLETHTHINTDLVEHFKELGARLMYSADDCAAAERQRLEQRDALETRRTVQTTVQHTHTHSRRMKYRRQHARKTEVQTTGS